MSPIEEQYFLQQEVFTKVKYDPMLKKFIIHADDYISLNLTTRQLKLLAKMCKENDVVLERLPRQMKNQETRHAFDELRDVQNAISSSEDHKEKQKLKQRLSKIKEQIVEGHLYFVHKLVCELYPSDLNPEEKDDIYQDIYTILVESIDMYDNDNYNSFIHFLKKRILKFISEKNSSKEPEIESVEQHLEDTEENEDTKISGEYIDDTIDETVFKKANKDNIMKMLDFVTPIQRKILILHFGLEDGVPRTQIQIARMLGSSQAIVNQHIQKALRKLKRYPYKNILLALYEREHPYPEKEPENRYTDMWMQIEINDGRSSLTSRIEYLEEQYFKNMPTEEILEIANKLPPMYRDIIILYYGICTEEIKSNSTLAHMLGISQNSVYQTRRKAMQLFKEELAKKFASLDIKDKYNNEPMVHHYLRMSKKH